jgi:hypothetical protein
MLLYVQEKNVKLSVQISPYLPELLIGDVFRMRQMIDILVENALFRVPYGGTITIRVGKIPSTLQSKKRDSRKTCLTTCERGQHVYMYACRTRCALKFFSREWI